MLGCFVLALLLGSVVLGVTYNNIHELLTSNHSAGINKTNQTRWLNTIIMSAVIYPWPGVLLENVTLVFESIKVEKVCLFIIVLYHLIRIHKLSSDF